MHYFSKPKMEISDFVDRQKTKKTFKLFNTFKIGKKLQCCEYLSCILSNF